MASRPTTFALHDGRAGNARQAEALAARLSPMYASLDFTLPAPWRWLAPRRLPGSLAAVPPAVRAVAEGEARFVVGCGRQAALATRVLQQPDLTRIQILDPRIDARYWDYVVVPAHDRLRGGNVLVVQGSLNPIDDAWLEARRVEALAVWGSAMPACAVMVGAPTDDAPFDLQTVTRAVATLYESVDGVIHVCASPRTPQAWHAALRALAVPDRVRVWADANDGPNPYALLLGCANQVVCTPDSVNMVSEACATRVPVEVLPGNGLHGRVGAFVAGLREQQRLRWFGESSNLDLTPLRETEAVAAEIKRRLGLKKTPPATPL